MSDAVSVEGFQLGKSNHKSYAVCPQPGTFLDLQNTDKPSQYLEFVDCQFVHSVSRNPL